MIGEGPIKVWLISEWDENAKMYKTLDGKGHVHSSSYMKYVNKMDDLNEKEKECLLTHYTRLLQMRDEIINAWKKGEIQ